jgi:hypothetical protein
MGLVEEGKIILKEARAEISVAYPETKWIQLAIFISRQKVIFLKGTRDRLRLLKSLISRYFRRRCNRSVTATKHPCFLL